MEDVKVRELPEKTSIDPYNYIIVEDEDGTKKVVVRHFRSLVLTSLYFNNIEELKSSTGIGLKEGDVCETLGYYTPGDGGGAKYRITYNPAAVEDGKLVHYLSYSDTLRAEIILEDKISVHQFGAVGDGVTDDTDAIQAAIDNAVGRTVEFTNNKTYVIRNTITVNNSNISINGNGAILYPHYVDGITITSKEYGSNYVSDIFINNLHFNCSKANSAIYVYNAKNVNIDESNFTNITSKGIDLKDSLFVNINKCNLSGNDAGSCIILEGSNDNTAYSSSRSININNCIFESFSRAIHLLSTGNGNEKINTLINMINCYYKSAVNGSYCVYIACPVENVSIYSNAADKCSTFLYFGGASAGTVSCKDIACINTNKVFDVGTTNGILNLSGNINTDSNSILFENMVGKLHTNIAWNLLPNGASFNKAPIGELFDNIYPAQYDNAKGYSLSSSTLTLREIRNMHVDWSSSTSNLDTISNGVKGQLLYIKSSTNKSILAVTNKIVLSSSSIQLGPYKGVLLKHDGVKWIQIQ